MIRPSASARSHTSARSSPVAAGSIRRATAVCLALTLHVLGQVALGGVGDPVRFGFNIDFNAATGSGAGAPASTYPGGAGQAGFWNAIDPPYTGTSLLRESNGVYTGFEFSFAPINGFVGNGFSAGSPVLAGNDALLLADGIDLTNTAGRGVRMTIAPLTPGIYDVSVYAIDPGSTAFTQIVWSGSTYGFTTVGGGALGNPFVMADGITFRRFPVLVLSTVQARPGANPAELVGAGLAITAVAHTSGFGSVNGIQIVPRNPTRLFVRPTSEPTTFFSDGLSWGSALRSLHHALEIAATTPSVTEIWMQRGTYTPDVQPFAAGDRTAAFVVPRGGLSIIGGFAGTETTLAERPSPNPATATNPASATILSGEIGSASLSDNSIVILSTADSAATTSSPVVLDRLTFIRAEPSTSPVTQYGAVLVGDSTVRLQTCRFDDNRVALDAQAGNVTVRDSDFTRNRLFAFIQERSVTGLAGQFEFERSRFVGNSVPEVFLEPVLRVRANGRFNSCLMAGNSSSDAVLTVGSGTVSLNNCTIAHNAAGGLVVATLGGASPPASSVTINNSLLWGNRLASAPTIEQAQVLRSTSSAVSLTIYDTIVEGWSGTLSGVIAGEVTSRNPRFVDIDGVDNVPGTLDDNFRLGPVSPARDSGWNASVVGTTDLDGNPRIVDDPVYANLGFPTSAVPGFVDRGCYEAQTPGQGCNLADVAGPGQTIGSDGQLTADDIIVFLNRFFAGDLASDVSGPGQNTTALDGELTADDIIVFLNRFFAGC